MIRIKLLFSLPVQSNVAIASAVTSYARIIMIPYITSEGVVYTDTDSIFTSKPLNSEHISKELGKMKDELEGCIIEEGYFLDIKKYDYFDFNKNGEKIEQSVISGVTRNSVSFEEIKKIYKGEIITREVPSRFYKNFGDLSIKMNNCLVTIEKKNWRKVIN